MGCTIPWMGWPKMRQSRSFVSRAELCSALGDVEEGHDGFLQQAASPAAIHNRLLLGRLVINSEGECRTSWRPARRQAQGLGDRESMSEI